MTAEPIIEANVYGLLDGVEYTSSDNVSRYVLPSRVATEKGLSPDEVITLSQLSGGNGISVYQSDGYSIDNFGNEVFNPVEYGNVFFNRIVHQEILSLYDGELNKIQLPRYEQIVKQFNKYNSNNKVMLLDNSVLNINGVEYLASNGSYIIYNPTFDVDGNQITDAYIMWTGDFDLDDKDTIILRI